ncbi:MAG TPA: hypothetical protein VE641_14065, partial [Chthoniobacterales bacterium]|nr:hypothetical protein [Chthoniobacterales bacterium]
MIGDWWKAVIAAKEHKERKKGENSRRAQKSDLLPYQSLITNHLFSWREAHPRPIHQTRNLRITYAG